MKGYTIEKSIDLLEKDVAALKAGGGGGGASNWNQLQGKPFTSLGDEFYNLDGDLTLNTVSADKVALPESSHYEWDYLPQAIEALAEDSNHFSDDIAELEESLDNRTMYSTTETVIGSWVDGRPVYRTVYEGMPALSIDNAWIPTQITKGDKKLVVNIGIINYAASGGRAVVEAAFLNNFLNVRSYRAVGYEANNYCIVLEYIKEA